MISYTIGFIFGMTAIIVMNKIKKCDVLEERLVKLEKKKEKK